jgi:hypothetical protein
MDRRMDSGHFACLFAGNSLGSTPISTTTLSLWWIANDLELYPDDDVGNVRMMEMAAEEGDQLELEVWIYHHLSG